MKKTISYPPMIILLDVLFVYLFILILNTSQENIQIVIPKNKIFKNGKLLTIQNNKYYEYKFNTKQLIDFTFTRRFNKFVDCNKQKECQEAKAKFGKDKEFFIILPPYLFDEISKLSLIGLGEKSCKRLRFFIKNDGTLDYKKLKEKNECLLKIDGFEKL